VPGGLSLLYSGLGGSKASLRTTMYPWCAISPRRDILPCLRVRTLVLVGTFSISDFWSLGRSCPTSRRRAGRWVEVLVLRHFVCLIHLHFVADHFMYSSTVFFSTMFGALCITVCEYV